MLFTLTCVFVYVFVPALSKRGHVTTINVVRRLLGATDASHEDDHFVFELAGGASGEQERTQYLTLKGDGWARRTNNQQKATQFKEFADQHNCENTYEVSCGDHKGKYLSAGGNGGLGVFKEIKNSAIWQFEPRGGYIKCLDVKYADDCKARGKYWNFRGDDVACLAQPPLETPEGVLPPDQRISVTKRSCTSS